MAINIIKSARLVNMSFAQAEKSLPSTITEKYILGLTASGLTNHGSDISYINAEADIYSPVTSQDAALPKVRQRLPFDTNFVCTERRIESITSGILELTATYTSIQIGYESMSEWSRKSVRSSHRLLDIWVEADSYPTEFEGEWPPAAVIAGTKVDMMGKPETQRVWVESFDIELHVDRALQVQLGLAADYFPNFWRGFINTRNDDVFISFEAGQVAFVGYSEALTTDPWSTYILHFVADEIGHLQQRVIPNVKGTVLLTASTTWAGKAILQADAAYWYNPFYRGGLTAFSTLWTFTEIEAPSPAFI